MVASTSCGVDIDSNEYDIVIVGCGPSAIGLLYGLLIPYDGASCHVKPNFTIAVIERGDDKVRKSDERTRRGEEEYKRDPKQWFKASHGIFKSGDTPDAVTYESEPQRGLHNRKLLIPTGRGIGGGMNINATIFTKPSEDDFLNWPTFWKEKVNYSISNSETKNSSRIMSGIVTIENALETNSALCTQNPPKKTITSSCHHNEAFVNITCSEDIYKIKLQPFKCAARTKKGQCRKNESESPYERINAFEALIKPIMERNPNLKKCLHFYTNVQVERILIDKANNPSSEYDFQARGIECKHVSKNVEHFKIIARRKVILCAGAILSPALLLVSGIGDKDELKKQGIKPLCEKKSTQWRTVGRNLRDHFIVTKAFLTPRKFWSNYETINGVHGWSQLDIHDVDDSIARDDQERSKARVYFKVVDGTSTSTIIPYVIASYFHRAFTTSTYLDYKNILNRLLSIVYHLVRATLSIMFQLNPLRWILSHYTSQILLCLLNPESTGSITIKRRTSKIMHSDRINVDRLSDFKIFVNPGYLTDTKDMDRIQNSWNVLLQVSKEWFSNCFEILPGIGYRSLHGEQYIHQYAADFGLPYFHFSGSLAMKSSQPFTKNDEGECNDLRPFIVEDNFTVRNVANLHICDASVIPGNISAPTASTCLGLGFIFANYLPVGIR